MYNLVQDPKQSKVVDKVAVGRKPMEKQHGGNIGGWSWNVFKMSKNQDLALAFAKWMASPDVSMAFARAKRVPARISIAALIGKEDPVLSAAIAANQQDGRGVRWIDTGPSWTPIENVMSKAIQEALIGAKEPAAALKDAKTEIEGILAKNNFATDLLPKLKGAAK